MMGPCAKSSGNPAHAQTGAIKSLLDRLGQRPNLDVTVLSGRAQADLEDFLGGGGRIWWLESESANAGAGRINGESPDQGDPW
jgi:trehalose-6-phosphatase